MASACGVNGTRVGWWAVAPRSSPFFPVLVPATWAAMSYPDISAVILDASFDDLVPLALKVMPDSWSECSSQACPSREGVGWTWELNSNWRWILFLWVGSGSAHC